MESERPMGKALVCEVHISWTRVLSLDSCGRNANTKDFLVTRPMVIGAESSRSLDECFVSADSVASLLVCPRGCWWVV